MSGKCSLPSYVSFIFTQNASFLTLLVAKCDHTKRFPNDTSWLFYKLTQFWHYLRRDSGRFHRLKALSRKTAPTHFKYQSHVVGPQVTENFCSTWIQIWGATTFSPLGFDQFARVIHRTQGNTFIGLLKGMMKDTGEQPDEEIHLMQEPLSSWGVSHSLFMDVLTDLEASWTHTVGISWRLPRVDTISC